MNIEHQNNDLPSSQDARFLTERLQFAVFLHATGRLCLLFCERSKAGRIQFVFEDPEHIGEQAELEFDRGASVSATDMFASQKFLRRKMTETLKNQEFNNQNIGVINYGYIK